MVRTMQHLHDTDHQRWRDIAVFYRTNAQARVVEESLIRHGVPYKVVGGTRFYDRREIKDAMAYLRAVGQPRRRGERQARAERARSAASATRASASSTRSPRRAGISFTDAMRRADEAGVSRTGCAWHRDVRRAARRPRRARRPAEAGPAEVLQTALDRSGYLAELEAEASVESNGRLENLGELVGSAREFTRIDEFLEQVVARRRHRRHRRATTASC